MCQKMKLIIQLDQDMWNLYFIVTKCKVKCIVKKKEETDYKMNEEKDLGLIFDEEFFS